jgi:hypothetical protein
MTNNDHKSEHEEVRRSIKQRFKELGDSESVKKARDWLRENQPKIETLFEHPVILEFVFEPLKGVFQVPGEGETAKARRVITQVAVTNAVIAGLPGSLGVGVIVAIALELWMAYALSKVVGLGLDKDQAIDTVIGWALGAGAVFVLFKQTLNLIFPVVTALMPVAGFGTAITQLIVTNLFGVMFWIMFEELKTKRRFKFPMTSFVRLGKESGLLIRHQFSAGVGALNPVNWKIMGERLWAWFKGDIPIDMPVLRGEIASTVVIAWILAGDLDKVSGPLGEEFVAAIRDRFSTELADASIFEIAEHMSQFDAEEMAGTINLVKGKLFERLVTRYENQDSDAWTAVLHEDESFPGSDVTFSNPDTGEQFEISLKATDSAAYLEHSLARYPDYPIITTDEVAEGMADNHMIWAAGVTNEELTSVTEENFDRLADLLEPIDVMSAATTGASARAFIQLWPFVIAHIRKKINKDQLTAAFKRVLPETGKALASRISYAVVFGPVFAWWLLARGVLLLTPSPELAEDKVVGRLIMNPV